SLAAGSEDIYSNIQRVGVNAERWIIGKLAAVPGRSDQVMTEIIECPGGVRRDDSAITDRHHDAVRRSASAIGHIDHDREPTPRQAVIANPRVTGKIARQRRGPAPHTRR